MYRDVLSDLNSLAFQQLLIKLDKEIAEDIRSLGCTHPMCEEDGNGNKALHAADFLRKPRGIVIHALCWEEFCMRLGLCCAGCRHRTLPPSLRFLSRKVYLGMVVVVTTVLRNGVTPTRMRALKDLVGVSRQTVLRWRALWKRLAKTKLWRARRGRLPVTAKAKDLPRSWLDIAIGSAGDRVLSLLRFIDIYTGGRYSGVAM